MSHRSKEITRISDKNKRHVSFSKRKGGLFKKAGKHASLTDAFPREEGCGLMEAPQKHLQYLSPLHSKIQTQFEDVTELFKLDMHSKDIFEMKIQELKEYVSFIRGLREKASMLSENGDHNVNLNPLDTSSLPYCMDLIHQQSINDLNHRGSTNAMNVCFSNGECEALFLCPQDEGIEMSSSLDLSETNDGNHLGSINYMNSFLCNGESRPKSLYPQDENIEMGCSFGLSEISDLNHHGSINDMNVYRSNGECQRERERKSERMRERERERDKERERECSTYQIKRELSGYKCFSLSMSTHIAYMNVIHEKIRPLQKSTLHAL
ncbi:hypothetical protein AMTRI_Chr12g269560 [Amborella trichopoda]